MERQQSKAVNRRHGRMIRLSPWGLSNRKIARPPGCTTVWVRKITHRFNARGHAALTWYTAHCGRRRRRKFVSDIV